MTKEEKIKEVYGIYYNQCKPDLNGYCLLNSWSFPFTEWVDKGFGYNIPKSLQGIENNNGWIKINEENDLPIEQMEYYWVIGENYSIHQVIFHEGIKDIWLSRYSHYQPIIKPKKPIF